MASAPIRQPRGPPSVGGAASPGPPQADAESILRRNKTVANPRSTDQSVGFNGTGEDTAVPTPVQAHPHRRSFGAATVDYAAAARQMRYGHGGRGGGGGFTVLSGAGTIGSTDGSLIRRQSARSDFVSRSTTEETLLESEASDDGPATELGVWGRSGLGRQSSLPSRKLNGVNPGLFTSAAAEPPSSTSGSLPPPPPRPPRRVYHPSIDQSASPPSRSHSRNRSLNMIVNTDAPYDPVPGSSVPSTPGSAGHGSQAGYQLNPTSVARTQSLRNQIQQSQYAIDVSTLGRSASMRTPGELSYSRIPHSPPPPPPPFSLATPPRSKSHLPGGGFDDDLPGATVRRHQSLTHDYGHGREPSQALLSLDQREDLRRRLAASPSGHSQHSSGTPAESGGHSRQRSELDGISRNLWTPGATGDDGWNDAAAAHQLQEALDQLSLRDNGLRPRHPPQLGDEPSWVTNLVGMPGQPSPQPPPHRQLWDDRSGTPYGSYGNWPGGNVPAPLLYQQQQIYANQQAQLKIAAGLPVHPGVPLLPQPGYNYLGSPFTPGYPAPPGANIPGAGAPVSSVPLSAQDLDVIELARSKGLNPATFDCRPPAARFFVIKSYTEDDVQKSLKHGVWSSTVLGNKRLDTAYREFHDKGPIYLLFSVNGSRHFCGVARQTSPVDENKTSSIWAQDGKWRGLFTLNWIFVRDIPTSALRHIRLNNTPERKPITNSRDTQELEYDAGCEVLQIFLDWQHKAKTSLLQDFAYYERMSANREGEGGGVGSTSTTAGTSTPAAASGPSRSAPSPGPGRRTALSPGPVPNRSGPSPSPQPKSSTPTTSYNKITPARQAKPAEHNAKSQKA